MVALVGIAAGAALRTQAVNESLWTMASDDLPDGGMEQADAAVVVRVLYAADGLRVEHSAMMDNAEEELRFLYDDEVIWNITAPQVRIGATFILDADQAALLAPGMDLDGNGSPDFLVETSTGGRMGGYEYVWIEWQGEALVVRDQLTTGYAAFHTARDINGDKRPELWVRDTQFLYWRTSRAESIAKDVIVALDDNGFRIAHGLMARPAPPEDEMAQIAAELRDEMSRMIADDEVMEEHRQLAVALRYRHTVNALALATDDDGLIAYASSTPHPAHGTALDDKTLPDETFGTGAKWILLPPPRLWDIMLDLAYTGHLDRADQFLDQTWPPYVAGKEAFRQDFWATLRSGLISRDDTRQRQR